MDYKYMSILELEKILVEKKACEDKIVKQAIMEDDFDKFAKFIFQINDLIKEEVKIEFNIKKIKK